VASLFIGIVVTLAGYGPLRLLLVGVEDSGVRPEADLGRDSEQSPSTSVTATAQSPVLEALTLSAQVRNAYCKKLFVDSHHTLLF
jgi:hypothetical protein